MGNKSGLAIMCCITFPSFVLQAVGFFTPKWVSNAECDSFGLFYHCCGGSENSTCSTYSDNNDLDTRVLALQSTSLAVMVLNVFGMFGIFNIFQDDDETGCCGVIGGCCLLCYPVAGLFSIIGGIVLATNHSTSELGYSFALCVTSGCYVLLVTICLCGVICYAIKQDGDDDSVPRPGQLSDISAGIDAADTARRPVSHHSESASPQQSRRESSSAVREFVLKVPLARYLNAFQHNEQS